MAEPHITPHLRGRRADAGLSQRDLAARVGISRQAVVAIEAGKQVPSTVVALQMARALRCRVEDLFTLPSGPRLSAFLAVPGQRTHTRRLAMGRVDGRWAAHPLEGGDRPGDGLLVGVPPLDGTATVEPLSDLAELERNVLVAGCAPLLGVLTGSLGRRHGDARATWIPANSTRALELLAGGLVHVAGLHLVDAARPGGHADLVQQRFPGETTVIVNLTRWRQGLVVAAGNPLGIEDATDLLRADVRFVRREPGAGARALVAHVLGPDGEAPGGGPLASGHLEVARLVALGLADTGIAIEAAALAEGLDFIPLAEERFDLVVPEARLGERPVSRLLDLIGERSFQADVRPLAGYDLSTAGHASTVGGEAAPA